MAVQLIPRVSRPYICKSCAKSLSQRSRRFATAASPDIYDVVCVGGGPAGLSLLTALRSSRSTSHLRLALVESQDLAQTRQWQLPPDKYSNRVSSLTPASLSFLDKMGAQSHLDSSRIQPYRHMRVWDGLSPTGRISFDSDPPDPPIAYMNENNNLTRALLARLEELEPISVFSKTTVTNISHGPPPSSTDPSPNPSTSLDLSTYPSLTLSDSRTLTTRLLIGADGLNSPVRTFANIPTTGWDYDRHGVVATLTLPYSPNDPQTATTSTHKTAYQRFLPTGPIALLPLPGPHASLVWTTTPTHAAHLKTLLPEDLLASINAAFRLSIPDLDYILPLPSSQSTEYTWRASLLPSPPPLLNPITPPPAAISLDRATLASFPLRLRHASTYIAPRTALIGDAAHTVHPLAGQGLNLGLGDSKALAAAIEHAVKHGADIGSEMGCLEMYEKGRWVGNQRMLGVVDKLHWLYSFRGGGVSWWRGWGLGVVDRVGEITGGKRWLVREAGGW